MEIVEELKDGKARICREYEYENYFDVYGTPEGYTDINDNVITPEEEYQNIMDVIDQEGLWVYYAQVRCACCGSWETVDSIGSVIGDMDDGYRGDFIAAIERAISK